MLPSNGDRVPPNLTPSSNERIFEARQRPAAFALRGGKDGIARRLAAIDRELNSARRVCSTHATSVAVPAHAE